MTNLDYRPVVFQDEDSHVMINRARLDLVVQRDNVVKIAIQGTIHSFELINLKNAQTLFECLVGKENMNFPKEEATRVES